MKKEWKYLIAILILGTGLRAYTLRFPYFIGNDAFLHASVIRQAMNGGELNNYHLSYGNPRILEPLGFYYITLLPAYIIGLQNAFLIMPLISGLIGITLAYYLMKDLFNKRTALLTALILALSIANIYRTSPNTYRGDGFYLTILIGLLYSFNKTIKGNNKQAIITGLLMGLSASIWNGYPLGVLIIISGLIINLTLKFIKNKIEKKDVIKTTITLTTYYLIELILITLNIVKRMFFTNNYYMHAIITFIPIIIGLIMLKTKHVKKTKVMTVLLIIGLIIIMINLNSINSMIKEGLFENSLFYSIGVSELLPPTQELLWTMLSWSLYLMWPGIVLLLLITLKKPTTKKITYLIWVLISTYLMLSYSRYNFIASLTVASMTALFIDYVYTKTKKYNPYIAISLMALLIIPYSVDTFKNINKVGPRMNGPWLEALMWAKTNLEPGMTVSWWDHGSWIQYYTGFPTVVDSVSGQAQDRIKRIAEFLTTNKTDEFTDWNASYLMLGGDVILYSGAVLGIAGTKGFEVSMVKSGVISNVNGKQVITYPAWDGRFEVYQEGTIFRNNKGMIVINKTFYANKTGTTVVKSDYNQTTGCLVLNPYMNLYFNDQACNSNYVRLMYGKGIKNFKEVYRNNFVIIYEIN